MLNATFLKQILVLDALACAGMGIGLAAGAGFAAPLLGLPEGFVRGAGLVLLPIAAFIFWVGRRPQAPAVWIVILGNLGWVAASLAVPGYFSATITALGVVIILAQAAIVLGAAALEYLGLRRATIAAA